MPWKRSKMERLKADFVLNFDFENKRLYRRNSISATLPDCAPVNAIQISQLIKGGITLTPASLTP
jgi:hypothetical protein